MVISMSNHLADRYERREELIDGKIVMMSPASANHTLISGNIFGIFWSYLKGNQCTPVSNGFTVYLTDNDHFVPDMVVVCDSNKIKSDGIYSAPDLVVEVLSPSTMRNDKIYKKEVYARCGVREYWLVSPGDKSIEIYRSGGNKFVLLDVYGLYEDWELAQMSEAERATVVTRFKCSLFDDLEISLEDIFYRTF